MEMLKMYVEVKHGLKMANRAFTEIERALLLPDTTDSDIENLWCDFVLMVDRIGYALNGKG